MRFLAALLVAAWCAPAFAQVPTVGISPTVSTLTTGTVLEVSASVSADRRYVNIHVRPQFSSLEGIDTFRASGVRLNPALPGGGIGAGNVGTGRGGAQGNVPTVSPAATPPQTPPKPQPGSLQFVEKDKLLLATPVPAFKQTKSLKDAAKFLADATRQNIVLGLRGLEQAGIDLNVQQQFDVPAGTLKDTLTAILKTAAPRADIVISADENVVQIMSQAQADNAVVTRTYYLEDILGNWPKIVSSVPDPPARMAPLKARPLPENIPTYNDVVGYRVPGRPAALIAAGQEPRYSTNIIELITSTVRPEIWKVNGGKIGEIAVVGNQVTIRAPISVQAILDGPKHFDPNARPLYVGYDSGSNTVRALP